MDRHMNVPDEVLAAARLITKWAATNNIREFAIDGIQHRGVPVAVRWRYPGYRWVYEDYKPDQFYSGRAEVQQLTTAPKTR